MLVAIVLNIYCILVLSLALTSNIRSEGMPYKEASSFTRIGGTVLSESKCILLPTKPITASEACKKNYI